MLKVHKMNEVISNQVKKNQFLKKELLSAKWEEIVGKPLAQRSEPVFIKENRLHIKVENSIWIQQMQMLEKKIIQNVNDFLKKKEITKLYFKVGKREKKYKLKKEEEINKIDIEDIVLSKEEIYILKRTVSIIENEEIKLKMYKLLSNNKKREIVLQKSGYKKCKRCESLFRGSEDICGICQNKKEKEKQIKIMEILKTNLGISFLEMKQLFQKVNKDEYLHAKNILKDRIKKEINIAKEEKKEEKMFDLAYEYFILETGIRNKRILYSKVNNFLKSFT